MFGKQGLPSSFRPLTRPSPDRFLGYLPSFKHLRFRTEDGRIGPGRGGPDFRRGRRLRRWLLLASAGRRGRWAGRWRFKWGGGRGWRGSSRGPSCGRWWWGWWRRLSQPATFFKALSLLFRLAFRLLTLSLGLLSLSLLLLPLLLMPLAQLVGLQAFPLPVEDQKTGRGGSVSLLSVFGSWRGSFSSFY